MELDAKDCKSCGDEGANKKTEFLLSTLIVIVTLLMITNIALFLRVNELPQKVLESLVPMQSSLGLQSQIGSSAGLAPGMKSHPFSLPDMSGKAISLRDFTDQKVLLAFFSTDCPICIKTYPSIRDFSEGRKDIQILMISRGSVEDNRRVIREQGFSFPVIAWDDSVAQDYQVPGTPFFYVINGEGVIVNAGFANSLDELNALVKD